MVSGNASIQMTINRKLVSDEREVNCKYSDAHIYRYKSPLKTFELICFNQAEKDNRNNESDGKSNEPS